MLEWLIRAKTNDGFEGLTIAQRFMLPIGDGSVAQLVDLLREVFSGAEINDLLEITNGVALRPGKKFRKASRDHGWMSILAYDLVGRNIKTSCVDLFSGKERNLIPAYDTTLYFDDLL